MSNAHGSLHGTGDRHTPGGPPIAPRGTWNQPQPFPRPITSSPPPKRDGDLPGTLAPAA